MGKTKISEELKVPTFLSKRWIMAYICSLGLCISSNLRLNLSMAIVCMVAHPSSIGSENNASSSSGNDSITSKLLLTEEREEINGRHGEFHWDKATQSVLLSAFFYGYSFAQIPVSYVAVKFGPKRTFGWGIFISALATLLIPVAARWDYRSLVILRVIIGIGTATAICCVVTIWSVWAPSQERARLISFSYIGDSLGDITTFCVSGFLCAYGFDNGWGSIFYVTGTASMVWTFLWFYLVSDTPDSHPTITQAERLYLKKTTSRVENRKLRIPWRDMFKSRGLWVLLTGFACVYWVYFTFLTALPTFMNDVLHYDIKENGVLSSLPYLVMGALGLTSGHIADFFSSNGLTIAWTRRLSQIISFSLMGTCIVATGYLDEENRVGAVALLTVGIGAEGIGFAGVYANPVDFGLRYAGIVYGITSSLGCISGMLAPIVNGMLTPDGTQEQWRNVFIICGCLCLLGTVVFGCFAVGEPEPWALEGDEDILINFNSKTDSSVERDNKGYVVERGKT